ncbi:hypothetical protein B296_00025225, partial [Ensete ventricosum]
VRRESPGGWGRGATFSLVTGSQKRRVDAGSVATADGGDPAEVAVAGTGRRAQAPGGT